MTNFERLTELINENTKGGYKAAEMTETSYIEHRFREGAGAHNTYSMSKAVMGCAVGILEAEGLLSTEDTVFSHIGDLFPKGYDKKWENVKLHDIMIHRTGVPGEANIDIDTDDFWAQGRTDFLAHILSQPIIHTPGTGLFVYCDTNYYIISRVVEKITGMTLAEFLQQRMFNVLEWRGHAWGCCPDNHTLGGTGLFADARDLAAYGLMLASGGEYKGKRILTPEWIEKARGPVGGYGYGFHNHERYFTSAGMYGQEVFIFPETKKAFVVLGHVMPNDEIREKIVPLYLDEI